MAWRIWFLYGIKILLMIPITGLAYEAIKYQREKAPSPPPAV